MGRRLREAQHRAHALPPPPRQPPLARLFGRHDVPPHRHGHRHQRRALLRLQAAVRHVGSRSRRGVSVARGGESQRARDGGHGDCHGCGAFAFAVDVHRAYPEAGGGEVAALLLDGVGVGRERSVGL